MMPGPFSVLVVTSEYGEAGGGLAKSCHEVSRLLRRSGWEVAVASPDPGTADASIDCWATPGQVEGNPARRKLDEPLRLLDWSRQVQQRARAERVGAVLAWGAGENGALAAEVARGADLPLVVSARGSEVSLAFCDPYRRCANAASLLRARMAIGCSAELVSRMRAQGLPEGVPSEVIPNPAVFPDAATLDVRPRVDRYVRFGTGARHLNEKKGVRKLLDALAYLRERVSGTTWHLDLVGEIDEPLQRRYSEVAAHLGLASQVSFHGWLSRSAFIDVCRSWTFAVQASPSEGCPNAVAEALQVGLPVVTTDTGYFAEQFRRFAPEWVVNGWSGANIGETIARLVVSGRLHEPLGPVVTGLAALVSPEVVAARWDSALRAVGRARR